MDVVQEWLHYHCKVISVEIIVVIHELVKIHLNTHTNTYTHSHICSKFVVLIGG